MSYWLKALGRMGGHETKVRCVRDSSLVLQEQVVCGLADFLSR